MTTHKTLSFFNVKNKPFERVQLFYLHNGSLDFYNILYLNARKSIIIKSHSGAYFSKLPNPVEMNIFSLLRCYSDLQVRIICISLCGTAAKSKARTILVWSRISSCRSPALLKGGEENTRTGRGCRSQLLSRFGLAASRLSEPQRLTEMNKNSSFNVLYLARTSRSPPIINEIAIVIHTSSGVIGTNDDWGTVEIRQRVK